MTKTRFSQFELNKFDYTLLMSCQRSVDQLNKVLLQIITELVGSNDFRLYLNSASTKDHNFYLYGQSDHDFCLEKEIFTIESFDIAGEFVHSMNHHYYPAILNDKYVACAITSTDIKNEYSDALVSLLAIYCNVLHLITDSKIDGLTGLLNRRSFDIDLVHDVKSVNGDRRHKGESEEKSSYLVMVDIDFFKRVNDQFGHLIGDEVLLTLSQLIQKNFREHDGLYRYGGEEFAIILREISHHDAARVLQRFCDVVRTTNFPTVKDITVSLGFTCLGLDKGPSTLIEMADKALYFAKENGRDQIADFQELERLGKLTLSTSHSDVELF